MDDKNNTKICAPSSLIFDVVFFTDVLFFPDCFQRRDIVKLSAFCSYTFITFFYICLADIKRQIFGTTQKSFLFERMF
jgi:hypothetical protein